MNGVTLHTRTMNIFQEAENAVDSSIGKHGDIVGSKEYIEYIENCKDMALSCFVHLLIGSVMDLDNTQSTEQWFPTRLNTGCTCFDQLTYWAHNLPTSSTTIMKQFVIPTCIWFNITNNNHETIRDADLHVVRHHQQQTWNNSWCWPACGSNVYCNDAPEMRGEIYLQTGNQ